MTTNPINQNTNEELHICEVCTAYEYFKQLVRENEPVEDAFHEAFDHAMDVYAEEITKQAYDAGLSTGIEIGLDSAEEEYKLGFMNGLKVVSEQIIETIEHMEDIDDDTLDLDELEEDCDCPDCSPELYADNPCDECDCEDECADVEEKIRRAIWD